MASASTEYSDEGGSFIAASQRPDGSWRKPRRVKDGYTPQDEVPLYESKGRQVSKHTPQYPVGLDPALIRASEARKERQLADKNKCPIPGLVVDQTKTSRKKKSSVDQVKESLSKVTISKKEQKSKLEKQKAPKDKKQKEPPQQESETVSTDPLKRLKNLRKRLKGIEEIELKIAGGESKTLNKEQMDKVANKKEVIDEIRKLESLEVAESI